MHNIYEMLILDHCMLLYGSDLEQHWLLISRLFMSLCISGKPSWWHFLHCGVPLSAKQIKLQVIMQRLGR